MLQELCLFCSILGQCGLPGLSISKLTQATGESTPAYFFFLIYPCGRTLLWPGGSVATVLALHSRLAVLCRDPSSKGSLCSLEKGYVTLRGSQKQRPLAMGASLAMVSRDHTQTRNSFAALDAEVPAPSSLGASVSRLDPEVPVPSSSVLSPSPVASTLSSDLQSSPTHRTVKTPPFHHSQWILQLAR
ncbi:unnamed protein product, partial [Coregonus sp. 'balchen']